MKRTILATTASVLALTTLAACGSDSGSGSGDTGDAGSGGGEVTVVASTNVWGDVAEAVVGHTLATSPETGIEAVRRVLAHTPPGSGVMVRLSPHDAETVRMVAPEGLPWRDRQVHVVPDPDLRSGDAVAECDSTTLDGRIAPALARVKEILAP